jgi:tripartite-type tricarboxylate transporter receptor subunit TctC
LKKTHCATKFAASILAVFLSLWQFIQIAQAADVYPSKPIRLILGYAPGGVADITARLIAQKMSDSMGQQIVVDNRPSAGGIVAAQAVASADPDGYTILHLNYGNAVSEAIFKKLPYDIQKDFEPVSLMGSFDVLMLVDKSSDIQSVADFIAKAKANPEKYNIGTVSVGSGQHMSASLFKSMTGLQLEIVPFKATSNLFMSLKSKDISVAFEIISPAMAMVKSGDLKPLAVSSSKRYEGLPQVPTLSESGVKGYDVVAWNGMAVPAKTPKAIIDRLNKEINLALKDPEVKAKFQSVGIDPKGGSPEDLKNILAIEVAKWKKLVAQLNMEKI